MHPATSDFHWMLFFAAHKLPVVFCINMHPLLAAGSPIHTRYSYL
jgi:hypothetical protein